MRAFWEMNFLTFCYENHEKMGCKNKKYKGGAKYQRDRFTLNWSIFLMIIHFYNYQKYFLIFFNEYHVQKVKILTFSIAHSLRKALLFWETWKCVIFENSFPTFSPYLGGKGGEEHGDANPGINGSGEAVSLCSGKC